ncbi:MAG: ChbG/HpnK family deacetylase [Hespellia sp.]|nr:ChbG/HpnK family deacetylase [Hespellia sp.]
MLGFEGGGIDVHADDFAITYHATQDIVRLCKKRLLDSISIIPNMSCFERCMTLYKREVEAGHMSPMVSVHLNFMEGHCLAPEDKIPNLVDENGYFNLTWGKCLIYSFLPWKYLQIRQQFQREISAQIARVREAMPESYILRVDSHQHTHMIPIVFDALQKVIKDEELEVEFIRNSDEPLVPFLKHGSLYKTYSPVNIIKNLIIKILAISVRHRLKKMHLPDTYLWGLVMSGCMDEKRMMILEKDMEKFSEKQGRTLEILFHPGSVMEDEIGEEFVKKGFVEFHLSKGRKIEYIAATKRKIG